MLEPATSDRYRPDLAEVLDALADLMADAGICHLDLDLEGLAGPNRHQGDRLSGAVRLAEPSQLDALRGVQALNYGGRHWRRAWVRRENHCTDRDIDVEIEAPLATVADDLPTDAQVAAELS